MNRRIDIESLSPAGCAGCRDGEAFPLAFSYAFQPIVNIRTRTIYAHEALVRGISGEGAYSVLNQVNDTNRYSFDQACRVKAVSLAARLGMKEYLSVNFLPNAVYRAESCIRSTLAACRDNNFQPSQLIFEVTEGEEIASREHLVKIFEAYRNMGFKTAIDDFGAGYAGLGLLSEYQPDLLKIDMGLVRGIECNPAKQAIVEGIMLISSRLGVTVIAEGIETIAERDYLRSAGVELMQGYLFCRPAFEALGVIDEAAW